MCLSPHVTPSVALPQFRCRLSLLVFAALGFLVGCAYVAPPPNIPPQSPDAVSLLPQDWYIYYSQGTPPNPSADTNCAWFLDMPRSGNGGHVNYVQTPFRATVALHSVTMTFKVSSDAPEYVVLDPGDILPATIHLFFEQQGDDLSNPNGRWWAQSGGYNLGSHDNETITITVPLTADQWTNVYGQYDAQAFASALANIGWIGLTYGGQYFWGHGVALASGRATFMLINYQVD